MFTAINDLNSVLDNKDSNINKEKLELMITETIEQQKKSTTKKTAKSYHDPILVYSILLNAKNMHTISNDFFLSQQQRLTNAGLETTSLVEQFIPNQPQKWKITNIDSDLEKTDTIIQEVIKTPRRDITKDPEVSNFLKKNPVFISMTTSPERINQIESVIKTLDLTHVDKLLLCLPKEFSRDTSTYTIPDFIKKNPKIKILRTNIDYGPITKILPAIGYAKKENPNSIVISIDDDIGLPMGAINELIYQSIKNNGSSITGAGRSFPENPFIPNDHNPLGFDSNTDIKQTDIVEGYGGIAYQANMLDINILKEFSNLSKDCYISDDLVISLALAIENISRKTVTNKYLNQSMLRPFPYGEKSDALHKGAEMNITENTQRDLNDIKYRKCMEKILEISVDPKTNKFRPKNEIFKILKSKQIKSIHSKINNPKCKD